jgi:ATP-dependent RNA helicase HelY
MTTRPLRAEFAARLGFPLDDFQERALDAIDAGKSVLVAAPTGSGKTVVAEYAVARALAEGAKAFYTTPLKALSNQKFGDFARWLGPERVGLLTGDNAINGEAPVVVMTTEVLRNMIYASSPALAGLRYVVLDEVHYLQDAYRGPVWEEVIIHAPPEVALVCLSATVSNAEEVAAWLSTVRGETEAVIEERRPVALHHLYMVGDRTAEELHLLPTFVDGRPNPEAARLDARSARPLAGRRGRARFRTPRRSDVVERLAAEGMLPAIYFIFSRAACDDAVRHCLDAGIRLTSPEEREAIRAIVEARVEALSDDDLRVLDYGHWLTGLEAGLAAHHAGMVPPFKEAVEACFAAGLVKVVFATETLALGINMPARSVVIEKLSKFTGEGHAFLTPGEYTQLAGRAGRRGIDEVGYAIVLWSPFVPFDQVAGLASNRAYALTSAFRPTYNMAANLVRRYSPEAAHHLLNLSLAQYQADRQVVRLEAQLERLEREAAAAEAAARCERGDVAEYRRLLRAAEARRRRAAPSRAAVAEALGRLRPGDLVRLPGRLGGGLAAVLSTARRRAGDVRVRAVDGTGRVVSVGPADFDEVPEASGRVELPVPYAPRSRTFAAAVAAAVSRARPRPSGSRRHAPRARATGEDDAGAHPVAACPEREAHLRAFERAERLRHQAAQLERRVRSRAESLARQFDRVLRVLEAWGYVDGWRLTEAGEQLAHIYHEADLLVAECLRAGLFDGLSPAEVAALASVFTYEARPGPGPGPAGGFPTPRVRHRFGEVEHLAHELNLVEHDAGLRPTRAPDPGFATLAFGWASGEDLADVLGDEEITGGDFVRNVKQLIDLLRQLGEVATDPATAASCRRAADDLFRGVVAASAVVEAGA